ncbi:hypothetical protein VE04_05800 [Pseudogymnoascus sp. 24MN13]|nr:hypothetical protein VE04_05800 [Pseudogymnoascus sp. 24MN13]
MPLKSPHPDIQIPQTDILSYLFPPGSPPSTSPLWVDSADPSISLSPAQLLSLVKRLALGLERTGIAKGEVTMVPVTHFGIVGAGYAFSAANPGYTLPEMIHQICNTGARLILAHPSLIHTAIAATRAIASAGGPEIEIFQVSDSFCQPYLGVWDWMRLAASEDDGALYSWPKLSPAQSMKTHYNLIANVEQMIAARFHEMPAGELRGQYQERWIGFLPLYHAYGQLHTMLMCLKLSIPVFIMKSFKFPEFLRCIQAQRITSLQLAPPILVMLAKRPETKEFDLSSVKDVLCGAAPLSRELQNECMARFGFNVVQGWGMTELTCGAINGPGGRKDDTGSVGELPPNFECKLLDEEGREVGTGEPGEVYIRGPNVCLGDVAAVNEKGCFWIVDRKKELIKVNALQVAPAELESVLLENKDVADAAVVGITLHIEEWPRAYVVLQAHARGKVKPEEIQSWITSRVAKHKWLVGGVSFVDEVPRLQSGKIQRKVVKEWAKSDAKMLESQTKARY